MFKPIHITKIGFNSTLRPIINTNLSWKWSCLKMLFKTRGIWKHRLFVWVWTENFLKTGLFKNNDIKIIMWFFCQSFPQTQIQNDLHFHYPAKCRRKTFLNTFSKWKCCFEISPAKVWMRSKITWLRKTWFVWL